MDVLLFIMKRGFQLLTTRLPTENTDIEALEKNIILYSHLCLECFLNMALVNRGYPEGVLFHSDRGSQYCSYAFRDILDEYQFVQSMSRKGNCWDNAVAESFFKSLKTEATDDVEFNTIEEAKRVVFDYIEVYYNRQRMHSSIQYQIPAEYEAQWLMKKTA